MTTPQWISDLKKLCEAATPGPWWFDGYSKICQSDLYGRDDDTPDFFIAQTPCVGGDTATVLGRANAPFIAASRTALPRLIEALEIALDALDELTGGDLASGEGIYKAEVAREALSKIIALKGDPDA